MTKELRPSPLGGIKRRAKAIKARQGIIHTQALEVAARQADFQGFKQARRGLGSATPSLNGDFPERPGGTNLRQDKFLKQCGKAWVQTLKLLNPDRKDRLIWSKPAAIKGVLERVLAHTRSHAHLPTGGGLEYTAVRFSTEPGALEFQVDSGRGDRVRPDRLILERVAVRPEESFLLLELASLPPSGVYVQRDDPDDPRDDWLRRSEEVVELRTGENCTCWPSPPWSAQPCSSAIEPIASEFVKRSLTGSYGRVDRQSALRHLAPQI